MKEKLDWCKKDKNKLDSDNVHKRNENIFNFDTKRKRRLLQAVEKTCLKK